MKFRLSALVYLAAASPSLAFAQGYPVKPIKFISPRPPGGTFDYAMRVFAERLNAEFNRAVRDPQFAKEKLTTAGLDPVGSTPERLREVLVADIAKYAKIVRDAKFKTD